jgi:hypothetical protein
MRLVLLIQIVTVSAGLLGSTSDPSIRMSRVRCQRKRSWEAYGPNDEVSFKSLLSITP